MFKFIKKIQNSDEAVKTRWMVILSSVSVVLVVFVWLSFFDTLFLDASVREVAAEDGGGVAFWQTMKSGAAVVYSGITEKLRGFGETLGEPKEYIISPRD